MDTDPGILCFKHCESKVFCFQLPNCCPVCESDLSTTDFRIEPFRVPYPFVRAAQHPCSIVIRPTTGDFLNDYQNSMDLHIGVTTSKGLVVEFDKNGMHCGDHTDLWGQCLVIDCATDSWSNHWDSTLQAATVQERWSSQMYNEDDFNCYTFVLTFLRNIGHSNFEKAATNRTMFCGKFIVPRTTAAGKYISLYRKLSKSGHYIMV